MIGTRYIGGIKRAGILLGIMLACPAFAQIDVKHHNEFAAVVSAEAPSTPPVKALCLVPRELAQFKGSLPNLARAVAKGLQQAFGQTVIVENRPGANTLLAMGQVARSAPDGHLLVTCTDTNMVYLPTIAPKQTFSLETDFAPITLAAMAEVAGMSPSCFIRSFKRSTGMTPHRFVVEQRVAAARRLLETSDLPIVEIALGVGFSSQSHFGVAFRQVTGESPARYRRAQRGRHARRRHRGAR